MAKKTFETPIKVTISTADLQCQCYWQLSEWRDEKLFKRFSKTWDWDAILNSTKFNKFVTRFILESECIVYADEICEQYFMCYEKVMMEIDKAYKKFVAENKKKEPTITSKYRLTLEGKKSDVEKTINTLAAMSDISIEPL